MSCCQKMKDGNVQGENVLLCIELMLPSQAASFHLDPCHWQSQHAPCKYHQGCLETEPGNKINIKNTA